MKNKVEIYENIFENKYAKLRSSLESLISNIEKFKIEKNNIRALEINNSKIEKLENKNMELRMELRMKIDLVQVLKFESKSVLKEIQGVIENLTKKQE